MIGHFTVVCSVTWPLNGSEVRIALVLIQTSLLLLCKLSCSNANQGINMTKAKKSLLPFKGQQNAGHSAENYKTVKSR